MNVSMHQSCFSNVNMTALRSVKECAKKWNMDSCKWMFADDKEIETDVSLMVDLRGELAQDIQSLNKIVAASRCSDMFAQKVEEIKEPMTAAKARGGR